MAIKAREVRELLRVRDNDQWMLNVSKCIEFVAEQQSADNQAIVELAKQMDLLSDMLLEMVKVSGKLRSTSDIIKRTLGVKDVEDDSPL